VAVDAEKLMRRIFAHQFMDWAGGCQAGKQRLCCSIIAHSVSFGCLTVYDVLRKHVILSSIESEIKMSIPNFVFRNWADTIEWRPDEFHQPSTEQDVVDILRAAAVKNQIVRVFGAGHSWSRVVPDAQCLINLDNLSRIVNIDREALQVTVQAGIRIRDLVKDLDASGLAMKNLGAIMAQSIAGAISTGTHGSGLTFGSLHTQIVGMKLATASGGILEISQHSNPDLLPAARVSVGALGVIIEVTLQCVPAYNLEQVAYALPFDEALDQMIPLAKANEHVRFYWFAGTDRIYVNTMNRTDKARTDSPLTDWIRNVVMREGVLGFFWKLDQLFPGAVNDINKLEAAIGFGNFTEVGPWYHELTTSMPPRHIECEYAIPAELGPDAIRATRAVIEKSLSKVTVPMEIRFVAADDAYLSPAFGRDVCYIGGYTTGEEFAEPYYAVFEPVMKSFGGRPHWGKQISVSCEELAAMYPRYDDFVAVRQRLDPNGMFANTQIHEWFQ